MKRTATANWYGTGKEGKGDLSTQSGILENTQYSYLSRFEQGTGTNPEELIAAAHAGCFTMKLAFVLTGAGYQPEKLTTTCEISLTEGVINSSRLTLEASIPGIDQQKFEECVENAKVNCPVSKLLNAEISVGAQLIQATTS